MKCFGCTFSAVPTVVITPVIPTILKSASASTRPECEGYIATRHPVELAWSQECVTREEALSAEMQIKGWSHKKKEAMMRGDWTEVSRLARSKSAHPSTGSGRTD
jgi:hypothetical protein